MNTGTESNAPQVRTRALKIRRVLLWQPLVAGLAISLWTVTSALVGGAYSYWKYQTERDDIAKSNAQARKLEAQRPFLEERMKLYLEAMKIAGSLVDPALSTRDPIWIDNARRFWQLRWAELELVGDIGIRNQARLVGEQIIVAEMSPLEDRHNLRWAIECLANDMRLSLEHSWGLDPTLVRVTVLKGMASKLPDGCNQGRMPALRPIGMGI